jgi:hypothetical protein
MSSTSEVLSTSTIDQAKKAAAGHDLKWLASQTLFSILDHLNKWIRKKYLSITARIRRMDDPEVMTAKDKVQTKYSYMYKYVINVRKMQSTFFFLHSAFDNTMFCKDFKMQFCKFLNPILILTVSAGN